MNAPINKPWVSSCLPIHKEFENLCLASVIIRVFELQLLFDVAETKESTDDLCSVSMPCRALDLFPDLHKIYSVKIVSRCGLLALVRVHGRVLRCDLMRLIQQFTHIMMQQPLILNVPLINRFFIPNGLL